MIWVFTYLLKVSIILAFAFGLYIITFKKSTFHQNNRFYLLASVALSFVAPLMPYKISASNALYSFTLPALEINQSVSGVLVATNQFNLSNVLLSIYLIITFVLLIKFSISIYQLINSWKGLQKDRIDNIILINANSNTAAYSFFNRIVLPANLSQNFIEYNLVMQHEKIHVNQKHSFDILLLELTKIVLWFNPIAYLIKNEMAAQHEFYVDRQLIRSNKHIESYGQLLINQTLQNDCLQFANAFNNSLIKNRINMMTKIPNKKKHLLNYIAVLPIVFTLTFLVACQKDGTDKTSKSTVYEEVEEMPKFVGGDDEMLQFLYNNINYPTAAKDNNIEGMVVVEFVVEKDGSISNLELLRDIGGGCGEEAMRVVSQMPKWIPGKQKGQAVNVAYKLPIRYKLQ